MPAISERTAEDGKSAPVQEWQGVELGYLSLGRRDAHIPGRLAVPPELPCHKLRRYQLEKCTVAAYVPLAHILSQVGTRFLTKNVFKNFIDIVSSRAYNNSTR